MRPKRCGPHHYYHHHHHHHRTIPSVLAFSLWRSEVFPRADADASDDGARWLIIGSSWSYVMELSDLSSCVLSPHTCVYAADVCVCALVCACVCLPEAGEKAQSACT